MDDQERELYRRLSLRNRKIVWSLTKLAVSLIALGGIATGQVFLQGGAVVLDHLHTVLKEFADRDKD